MAKIYDKVKFFDKVKFVVDSAAPTYSLQRNVTPTEGGSEITFTVNTTNVADGTSLPYTITGVSQEDVISGDLTGSFTVASNTASTTLEVALEPTSPGVGSAALALNNGAASISVFPAPTYSLSRSASSVDEGSSVTFTLTTTGVADGTSVPYSISGISAGDLSSGSLTGNFVVSGGSATITLTAANDSLTEGTETISITAAGQSSSASVNDTSLTPPPSPTYTLSRSAASVNEGSSVTFTLTTTNVANGTSVPYSISGISAEDLSSGSLSGNFAINNGSATVTLTTASDALTEGTETITITAGGQTSSTAINDNSFNPVTGPAETVLLLAGDGVNGANNNGFSDSSSNNFTITKTGTPITTNVSPFGTGAGESVYFDGDGSTNLLNVPVSAFNFGTEDFTVEYWVNPTKQASSYDVNPFVILGGEYPGSGVSWNMNVGTRAVGTGRYGLAFVYGQWGSFAVGISTNNYLAANQWQHVAVTRQGTTWRIFVNGVSQTLSTYNENTTWDPAFNFNNVTVSTSRIGTIGNLNPFYLSNVRFVRGTALYTSDFSVPTTPLTNVTGTSLLLNTAAPGIVDGTNKNPVINTIGNVAISTSIKKYGTGSMYFDGNGDYLQIPANSNFALGTGDFTVECWYYPTASKIFPAALELGNHVSSNNVGFFFQNNSSLTPMVYSGAFFAPLGTPSITLNDWNHIVWQRTSGALKIFVNGTGSTDTALFTNNISLPSQVSVGYTAGSNSGINYYTSGYIDDLRITKNLARYTSNFTPPTGPLTIDV